MLRVNLTRSLLMMLMLYNWLWLKMTSKMLGICWDMKIQICGPYLSRNSQFKTIQTDKPKVFERTSQPTQQMAGKWGTTYIPDISPSLIDISILILPLPIFSNVVYPSPVPWEIQIAYRFQRFWNMILNDTFNESGCMAKIHHQDLRIRNRMPSWEFTYPLPRHFWRWLSFSKGWIC